MGSRSSIHRVVVLGIMVLSVPAFAAAQHGGGMAAGGFGGHVGAVGHAAPVMGHAAPATRFVAAGAPRGAGRAPVSHSGIARAGGSGRVRSGNTTTGTRPFNNRNFSSDFGETNFNDVPGLGFDFPHLAAISGGRRNRGGFFGGGFPFFDSGFLFGSPSVIIEQAPPADVPQEGADAIAGDTSEPPRRPSRTWYSYQSPDPAAQSAPQPDAEQYVFVRRDGSLLFGVAYSWDNGTLRYVTPDGVRRSIGQDALDLSATEQFNEQRGLNFHAPA